MEGLKNAVTKALLYFDIFSFPLKLEEAHRYCSVKADLEEVATVLWELVEEKQAWYYQGYFMAQPKEEWVRVRQENFRISCTKLKTANRNARLIGQFPFVRAVAISGSLSKYSADEHADIDYFIITRSRRLWICRSLLHLFKKLTFLFGKQHDFCMNYFLDEEELELKDKNYYTAIESITVIPMYGTSSQYAFYEANEWVASFFPNYDPSRNLDGRIEEKSSMLKRGMESLLSGWWASSFNQALCGFTIWWWRQKLKWNGFPMQYFDHDFRATKGESKNHPNDKQRFILAAFQQRIRAHEKKWGCLNQDV